jgi:glutamyl-tRNA reductase
VNGEPLGVILADDHTLVRSGIRRILESQPDIVVVDEASDGRAALEAVRRNGAKVLVLDLGMEGPDGLEVLRAAKAERPDLKVLVLTMHAGRARIARALQEGADGYLLKDSTVQDLVAAVRAITEGRSYFAPIHEQISERSPGADGDDADAPCCPHQAICAADPDRWHFHTVAAFSGLAALRAFTISQRTVDLAGLQRLAMTCDGAMALHERLSADGVESLVLQTCNRTELYWRARVPGDDEAARRAFADAVGASEATLMDVAWRLSGEAAAEHAFRVCCGLESLMLGEAEILGQVRAALEACRGAGPFLGGVFTAALRAGGRARADTTIGVGALSVASAAVQWLSGLLPLRQGRVLVVGAGHTGRKAARQLRAVGIGQLVIANRTQARADALAASLHAAAVGLDQLDGELERADAVICAAGAATWVMSVDQLSRAVAARPSRPLIVVDLAMPPCVEPGPVEGVTRASFEDIEALAEANRRQRQAEVPRVEALIARELEWLRAWARHRALNPLVADLRRKVEAIRCAELARARDERPQQGEADAALIERVSRRLIDRILALPLAALEDGDLPLDTGHAEYLRRLFALDARTTPWA